MSATVMGKKLPAAFYRAVNGQIVAVGVESLFECKESGNPLVSTSKGEVWNLYEFAKLHVVSAREADMHAEAQRKEKQTA